MSSRIASGTAGALALSIVLICPGIVAAKPITGNVNCELSGSATLKPGLPFDSPGNATKKLKTKITFTGTLSNCTGSQTNTKKGLQIQAGTITAKGTFITEKGQALPSCIALTQPAVTPITLKATVKFTNAGKTIAKSVVVETLGTPMAQGTALVFGTSGTVTGGTAFKGQNLGVAAVLDLDLTELATVCQTGTGLATLNFTGAQGVSMLASP